MSIEPSATLQVKALELSFAHRLILPRISLQLQEHVFACLLGPSGCGKTTLLRAISGLERPTAGEVWLGGRCLHSPHTEVAPDQRQIGMVFQQPNLFPHLSVEQNITFGIRHQDKNEQIERMRTLLHYIGMQDFSRYMPHQLSGGQQHRVALARALAPKPKLLLLDEPFAHLDPQRRVDLRRQTLQLTKREGVTCMMVTHDPQEAMQMGDVLLLMDAGGHIRQHGTAHDLYHHPVDAFVAKALGEMNIMPANSDGDNITTALGRFAVDTNMTGTVTIGIRPQSLHLSHGDVANGVQAQVTAVLCTGPEDFLTLKLADGTCLQARLPHDHHWKVGDDTALSVNPQDIHVFAQEAV